jgi:hypothetical protein
LRLCSYWLKKALLRLTVKTVGLWPLRCCCGAVGALGLREEDDAAARGGAVAAGIRRRSQILLR